MATRIFPQLAARRNRSAARFLFLLFATVCAWILSATAVDPVSPDADGSRLRSIVVDSVFDPARHFLDATARLSFARPAAERRLWLAKELQLNLVRGGAETVLDYQRDSAQLVVQCPGQDELELRYSGRLVRNLDVIESSWELGVPEARLPFDDCFILSYIKDFYPHPQLDFAPTKMNFRVPGGWSCLGSGTLLGVRREPAGDTYSFDGTGAKGMALVCGRFRQIGRIDWTIPIRLHALPGFRSDRYFSESEIARVFAFYNERFGALHVPEVNVLLRIGRSFSGISFNGLIVFVVDESWGRLSAKARKDIQGQSPLSIIGAETDLLVHEAAHQWWGGLVSWKTINDNWITEGLATYSTMLVLRELQGDKAYLNIRKKLRWWVKKCTKLGVPADGFKLKLLNRDPHVYQTLVYVKPALMLAALADEIGEGELCLRLKGILEKYRSRNLDSAEFLRLLSAGDSELFLRLNRWISSKELPDRL
jgi:hypothetical protein